MNLNRITLAFTGAQQHLESLYQSYQYDRSIKQLRIIIISGLIILVVFGLHHYYFIPEKNIFLLVVRFGIFVPIVLALLLFSFTSVFFKFWQFSIFFGVTLGGLLTVVGTVYTPLSYNFYIGLIIVLMFGYTLLQARFVWASLSGIIIIAGYEICSIWISPMPSKILLNSNFFLISFNFAGMMACYTIEYYNRRNYYLLQLLDKEKEKVNQINKDLAEKVSSLEQAMENINLLKGFIPICAHCKKIRDDKGYWNQVEKYIAMQPNAKLSHSLCPDCAKLLYNDFLQKQNEEAE